MEAAGLLVLGAVEKQFLFFVDAKALPAGEEPDFETSFCEDCDTEKSVGASFHNAYFSKNRTEVGILGAVEGRAFPIVAVPN